TKAAGSSVGGRSVRSGGSRAAMSFFLGVSASALGGSASLTRASCPLLAILPLRACVGSSAAVAAVFGALGRALAGVGVEDALAQADVVRRGLDQLVGVDVFDRALQREAQCRGQLGGLVLAGGAHVVEVLLLHRVHRQVAGARVFPDQHAFV